MIGLPFRSSRMQVRSSLFVLDPRRSTGNKRGGAGHSKEERHGLCISFFCAGTTGGLYDCAKVTQTRPS